MVAGTGAGLNELTNRLTKTEKTKIVNIGQKACIALNISVLKRLYNNGKGSLLVSQRDVKVFGLGFCTYAEAVKCNEFMW